MIKLGQILYQAELDECHTKAGYRPRLIKSQWVVCKVGKTKGSLTPIVVSDGKVLVKFNYYPISSRGLRPNEVFGGYYKTEIAAVRAWVEKKNPYTNPEWAAEWEKDQAVIKRAIAKLRD